MTAFLTIEGVSRAFGPNLSLGERIAARLGAAVETRSVRAVSDVSLGVAKGETLGLVGESGCGKSTLGRVAAGILAPDTGHVLLDGAPVMVRGLKTTTRVQTVFQDPFASLDPRMKVGEAVAEGPIAHGLTTRSEAGEYVANWFGRVGLDPSAAGRFPHQFSGGQRQRIAIARALAMQPDLLICDEPVASLDVSIQAQIINLFLDLRRDLDLTCLFISHDLSVVRHVSDQVAVMYLGRVVELGETERVFTQPAHPYTAALLASVPKLVLDDDVLVSFVPISGEIPSPLAPPPGCHFAPRCPLVEAECRLQPPPLRQVAPGRLAACRLGERQLAAAPIA
jgi:peptide/nickel transport system ATP-binding protein